MTPLSPEEKAYFSAGIIALSLAEKHHISAHKVLVERERAYLAGLIQGSFVGLADLSSKASATVVAFDTIDAILKEGRSYFYGDTPPHPVLADPTFSLRRGVYALGKADGFERTLKKLRRMFTDTIHMDGQSHKVSDIEQMLCRCWELERRRVEATHSFSRSVDECIQRLSKDKHLQNTLCAITGHTDAEKFTQERKEWARRSTKLLHDWNNSATNAGAAFSPNLSYDGWLVHLAKYKEIFSTTASETTNPTVRLSDALTVEKKRALAEAVVSVLDDIARLARKHSTMPESPIKDILRIHFVLRELEKELPPELLEFHLQNLQKASIRVLNHPDFPVYLIAVECDTTLPEDDKAIILRHFTKIQELIPRPSEPPQETRNIHEKRTRIRRELKQSLESDRTELEMRELVERMQELRGASNPTQTKREATVRFFPPRLQQEFDEWLSGFQGFTQSNARDLLTRAAKGERVDSKHIPIEKKIFELRLLGGSAIRMYCTRAKGGELVMLGFGTKTSQNQDILTAHERYRNFTAS